MWKRIRREPAIIVSLLGAVLTLGVAFGLKLTAEQRAALDAIVILMAGLVIRSRVSPVVKS